MQESYLASSKPKDFSQPILHIFSHTDDPKLAIAFTPSDYPSNANLNLVLSDLYVRNSSVSVDTTK